MKRILLAVVSLLAVPCAAIPDNWIIETAFNGTGPSIVEQEHHFAVGAPHQSVVGAPYRSVVVAPHQFATHFTPYWDLGKRQNSADQGPSENREKPRADDTDKDSSPHNKDSRPNVFRHWHRDNSWSVYLGNTWTHSETGGYNVNVGYRRPETYSGRWEWVETEEWVPGYFETIWIPPQYQDVWIPEHYDLYGNWVPGYYGRVLVFDGYYTTVWREGYYRTVLGPVWVAFDR
jgi:hypothetical protein